MAGLNAAELLARVKKRKQELLEQASRQAPAPTAPPKRQKHNPYVASDKPKEATAKPRLALQPSLQFIRIADESELSYLPLPIPKAGKEWWDQNPVEISNLVYRPGRTASAGNGRGHEGATMHLTTAERKRKRKLERSEKMRDAQERIRLGIDPPPQPKLKVSNVAAVFGPEFVRDPTRFEELARRAEAERQEAHERDNKERQLSSEQRWSKHEAKVHNHRSQSLQAAVFRVDQLDEDTGKERFLIDYTAKKFLFTGAALLGSPALVIVEGGEPEVAKFTKLLTRKVGGCMLLWTGVLSEPNFKAWSLHKFPSELLTREFLRNHRAIPYYLLMHDAPPQR